MAGAATVVVTAAVTRELGGGRRAQVMATIAVTPLLIAFGGIRSAGARRLDQRGRGQVQCSGPVISCQPAEGWGMPNSSGV